MIGLNDFRRFIFLVHVSLCTMHFCPSGLFVLLFSPVCLGAQSNPGKVTPFSFGHDIFLSLEINSVLYYSVLTSIMPKERPLLLFMRWEKNYQPEILLH